MPVYSIATPIGNLDDVSTRALSTLKELDLLLCEDTRVTKKLLARYGITVPLKSVHEHTSEQEIDHMISPLAPNGKVGFVTDAGTPGLADPAGKVIAVALRLGFACIPMPGASSLTALISVCDFPVVPMEVHGFAPHKKGRQTLLQGIIEREGASFLCESPHRIAKTLEYLVERAPERKAVVGKELTKQFEAIYRGTLSHVLDQVRASTIKGEYVLIVAPKAWK